MSGRLSAIRSVAPQLLTSAELVLETPGESFTDITHESARFVEQSGAGDGVLLLYLRHTSASLVIQENADPDVQTDLVTALHRLAPADGPWVHTADATKFYNGLNTSALMKSYPVQSCAPNQLA